MPDFDLDSAPTMKPGESAGPGLVGHIDQYELVRKLGGGGFGVVWLVRDTVSGVKYALKTLHPLLKTNEEELERVRTNFALVAKLSHPNIATAHVLQRAADVAYATEEERRELRVMSGDPVMLMSYAPGVTLSKWRKQFPEGKVPLEKALEIGRQIASALDYAHGEYIVHRDIKPSNVMVETDSKSGAVRVRVLDFGLASEIRSSLSRISQESGETSGTPPYMAPEQWMGKRQDGRTDQYAFACLTYALLDGNPPFASAFETGNIDIIIHAVVHENPEPLDILSRTQNEVLLKALAKNREERFATCAEFIATLAGDSLLPKVPLATDSVEMGDYSFDKTLFAVKVKLSERLAKIPEKLANDLVFKPLYEEAYLKAKMADEALKAGMKKLAFGLMREANDKITEAEGILKSREEAKRRIEAERKAREDAERKAKAEAERKAREEAERRIRENAEREVRERAVRRARAETEFAAQYEATKGRFAGEVRKLEIAPGVLVEFVWVEPGTFIMGGAEGKTDFLCEESVHEVTLNNGYWIGKFVVTKKEWQAIMEDTPSEVGRRLIVEQKGFWGIGKKTRMVELSNCPVCGFSEGDCQDFIRKINDSLVRRGELLRVRLPSEEQWEFAARGGTKSMGYKYSGSDNIDEVAWYLGNSGFAVHEIGTKKANELGIYDMSGNVWECCLGVGTHYCYHDGIISSHIGPSLWIRGGSCSTHERCCYPSSRGRIQISRDVRFWRSMASRLSEFSEYNNTTVGLRLVASPQKAMVPQ